MGGPAEPQNKVSCYSKVVVIFVEESVFSWECVAPEEPPVHGQVPDEVVGRVDHKAPNEEEQVH